MNAERPKAADLRRAPSTVLLVSAVLALVIFAGDLALPAEVPSVPYAALVLAALWLPWQRAPLFFAAGATALLLLANLLSPSTAEESVAVANVTLSLAAIWICGVLCHRFKVGTQSAAVHAERLRAVIQEAVDPIILIDAKGLIVSFNPAAERVFGYRVEEVEGRNVGMLMPSPDRQRHDVYMHNYLETGIKKIIGIGREVVAQHKDGTCFPVRLAVAEASSYGGRYFVGTLQDLTEQKAKERALQESEAHLRAIVDSAVDPIIVIDERGIVEAFNRAGERVLGFRAVEVIGQNVQMLMPSPDRERHDEYMHRYRTTGVARIIGVGREVFAQHKQSTLVPVRLAIAEANAGGRRRFVGMLHDLTSQREAQRHLVEERNFVAAILDTTDALVFVADRQGGILRINRAAEVQSGWSTGDFAGRAIWELVANDQREQFAASIQSLLPGNPPMRGEHQFTTRTGDRRIVEWAASGMWTPAGALQFLVLTGIDTTLRHRTEDALNARETELHDVQAQLYRASRLGDLGEMATAIAHELNQPLTAVLNYVQTSRDLLKSSNLAVPPKILEFLEKAGLQADRAGMIIRRLRRLYERGESEMVPTDVNVLVRESIALALLGANEKGVKVSVELAPELPELSIDRVQIQQVIFNLVRNAVEALDGAAVRELRIATRRQGSSVEVSVQDTGPGLAEEIAAKLFEPFMTTKASGMGLGLSICRSIIDSHGGTIGATSTPGAGARFAFSLPLDSEERENV